LKIGLGTAQFGLNYGVSNREGMTTQAEVSDILKYAEEKGITILDTAPAYGTSEDVLGLTIPSGSSFKIVTKTPVFMKDKIEIEDSNYLVESFHASRKRMKRPNLYGLLVHHSVDLQKKGGHYLWAAMQSLKSEGFVQKIGVSVYSPEEVKELLPQYPFDLVQLPFNVFDQRMAQSGTLRHLKSLGIEIHSRSIFLQGLLLMSLKELPDYFSSIRPLIEQYQNELEAKEISPVSATINFVYRQPDIDAIIVGVNNKKHLQEIVESLYQEDVLGGIDFDGYAILDEAIINPSKWNLI